MRRLKSGRKLGRNSSHRKAMYRTQDLADGSWSYSYDCSQGQRTTSYC